MFPRDLWENGKVYFQAPSQYDHQVVQKKWNPEVASFIQDYSESVANCESWNAEIAHHLLSDKLKLNGWGFGKIMPGLRLALTGAGKGPDLMQVMEILGKEETIKRLNKAIIDLRDAIIEKP